MKSQLVALLLLPFVLLGCSDSSDRPSTPPPPSIAKLSIEPPMAELDVETSESFRAIAEYSDGVVTDVSQQAAWSLEFDTGVLEVVEQGDASGHLVVRAVMPGQENVIASLDAFSASASVTVDEPLLVSIELSPASADILVGSELGFSALGTYEDGHTQDLTDESEWASSSPDVASVSEAGLVTARSSGGTTISASLDQVSGSAGLAVHEEVELESIEVSPQNVLMFVEGLRQFNAVAHYSDGSEQQVTRDALWISSDTDVVAQDNSRKGLFHAISEGSARITAELGISNQGSTTVTVEEIVLTHIIISPGNAEIAVGETRRYFTEAMGSDGSLHSLNRYPNQSYEVSDPGVAQISNSPDTKGQLTGLRPGTAVVTTRFEYQGEVYTDQATLTVCEGGC